MDGFGFCRIFAHCPTELIVASHANNKRKVIMKFIVSMTVYLLGISLCFGEELVWKDDFSSYNQNIWGSQTESSISVNNGNVTINPPQGQANLVSIKKIENASLEMRVKFDKISSDSTIFYYLGFQSVVPWAENVCAFIVQDGGITAWVQKVGETGVHQQVAEAKAGIWYTFKIIWRPESVIFSIDDKVVYIFDKPEQIPDVSIPVFVGANSLRKSNAQPAPELVVDGLELVAMQNSEISTSKIVQKASRINWNKCVGDPNSTFIIANGQKIVLENSTMSCELSCENGISLTRLYNKVMEEECFAKEGAPEVFKIQGKRFLLSSKDFEVNDIQVSENVRDKQIRLKLINEKNKIETNLLISLGDTGHMTWTLSMKNNSAQKIKLKPIFPILNNINIAANAKQNYYFYPWRTGIVGKTNCDLSSEYGGLAWMQVIAIFNPDVQSGIYIYPQDDTGAIKGMLFKKMSSDKSSFVKHNELIVQHEVPREDVFEPNDGIGLAYYYLDKEIAADESYQLPPTVIALYRGNWKEPLKDYSDWAHTWYKHVNTPQWFYDCFSFVNQHPTSFYDEKQKKYCVSEKLAGNEQIFQWAFWDDYQEMPDLPFNQQIEKFQSGDFEYNKHRGGLNTFKQEIESVQGNGARVTLYINHRFCFYKTKTGQKHADWAAVYDPGGAPATYGGPNDKWVMCFYDPNAWADYITSTCARVVKDTGIDGIYLDELALPRACYNQEHYHNKTLKQTIPISLFIDNIVKARTAIRNSNPDAILMTEHAGSDYFSQFFDGSWAQTFYSGFPFSEKYFDENSLNYFRFCFPEFKQAEWGPSSDGPHRCFFNAIGFDWGNGDTGYLRKISKVLKENSDAAASKNPEPLVETKAKGVLANKFSVPQKTIYTIYNKSGKSQSGEIIEVEMRDNYHWVEVLYDNEVEIRQELVKIKNVLSAKVNDGDVICLTQLPCIIKPHLKENKIDVELVKSVPNSVLMVYGNEDSSHCTKNSGIELLVIDNHACIDTTKFPAETKKIIFKLISNSGLLIDEAVVELK